MNSSKPPNRATLKIQKLYNSEFRTYFFRYRSIPLFNIPHLVKNKGVPVQFNNLCKYIRLYLSNSKLIQPDGLILCDALISQLVSKPVGSKISFFEITKSFRSILE